MISTQLDLFGGPPKPPKNIREEEAPVVAEPLPAKAEEPVLETEPEIRELTAEEPVLEAVADNEDEDLPEWIDQPVLEAEPAIMDEPSFEPFSDEQDEPLVEFISDIPDEKEPEPDVVDEGEYVPDSVEEDEYETESELEEEPEHLSDLAEVQEYDAPFDVEEQPDNKRAVEITADAASIPSDTVHVQLPSHEASPVIFTSLTPVEGFVVEEEQTAEKNEPKPEEEEEEDAPVLEDDDNTLVLQDEEPPSPPFMVEAITSNDVIIGGEPAAEVEDAHAENANETKEGQLQIPDDEKLFLRQYYTMRETSTMFGVNQSLLRYWENEFDVLKPKKNRKGDRYFRPEDIKNLELIYHLLKVRKFTIEGAREYIKSKKKALDTFELVQRLEKLKLFLHELKTHL